MNIPMVMYRFTFFFLAIVLITKAPISLAENTTSDYNGRFQVIQSPLTANITIKVDKHTGDSWRLVTNAQGEWAWKSINRVRNIQDTKRVKDQINYQVYTSSLDSDFTMMVNINTGATWYLSQKKGSTFWVVFY